MSLSRLSSAIARSDRLSLRLIPPCHDGHAYTLSIATDVIQRDVVNTRACRHAAGTLERPAAAVGSDLDQQAVVGAFLRHLVGMRQHLPAHMRQDESLGSKVLPMGRDGGI